MPFAKGDSVEAVDPDANRWVKGTVRKAESGGAYHIQFASKWRKVASSKVRAPQQKESMPPPPPPPPQPSSQQHQQQHQEQPLKKSVAFSATVTTIPSPSPSPGLPAKRRRVSAPDEPDTLSFNDLLNTIGPVDEAKEEKARAKAEAEAKARAKDEPETPSLGEGLLGEASGKAKMWLLELALQVVGVFKVSGAARRGLTLGELSAHVRGLGETEIAALTAAAPRLFSWVWVPLSRDERAIRRSGASHLEVAYAGARERHVLRMALRVCPLSVTPETIAPFKKRLVEAGTRLAKGGSPPPYAIPAPEEAVATPGAVLSAPPGQGELQEVAVVRGKKEDLLEEASVARLQSEVDALKRARRNVDERYEGAKRDAPALKKKGDKERSKETRRQLKTKLASIVAEVEDKVAVLREKGVDVCADSDPLPGAGDGGGAAAAADMVATGVSTLLPQLAVAQRREGLRHHYGLLREWSIIAQAAHKTNGERVQLEAYVALASASGAFTQKGLERDIEKVSAALPVGHRAHVTVSSPAAALLTLRREEGPAQVRAAAWRRIGASRKFAETLAAGGLAMPQALAPPAVVRTVDKSPTCAETVKKVAVAASEALAGAVVAAIDISGVPSDPSVFYLNVVSPPEKHLLKVLYNAMAKALTDPKGKFHSKYYCTLKGCQVKEIPRGTLHDAGDGGGSGGVAAAEARSRHRVNTDAFLTELVALNSAAPSVGAVSGKELREFARGQLSELQRVCPDIVQFDDEHGCVELRLHRPTHEVGRMIDAVVV
eukprot:Rhum_TRINITY_DN12748_c0_g1::Rhum_TRINITY_DN12748_c0_g1_i1::g.53876::m.53876